MPQGPSFETNIRDSANAEKIANAARDVNIYEAPKTHRKGPSREIRIFGVVPLVVADFVPREALTNAIDRAEITVVTAVHGIGGVGKSQLAAKYFNEHQRDFDYAVWVDMRDRRGRATYEMISMILDLPTSDLVGVVEATRTYIKGSPETWLLVFDNCDHPSHLEPLLPQSPGAKIIVTSRYRYWAGYAVSVEVDVFDTDTAVKYLCERAGQSQSEEALHLARGLGCLPLALSLAGSYCNQQQLDFREYHEALGANITSGLASSDPTKTDRAVRDLWERSLNAAQSADSTARPLMELLCVLDWTEIGRSWFSVNRKVSNLGVLFEYSLIELTQTTISVRHNLIADGVAGDVTDRGRLQADLVDLFRDAITMTGAGIDIAENLAEPVRHLEHITKYHPHLVTPELIPVLNQAVWQLQDQGSARTKFAETVHQLSRTLNGPEHPYTLSAALRLAATYWNAGDYQRTVDIAEFTLVVCERVLGVDHPQTLNARNNLAASYAKVGRHEEALDLSIRALSDRERVLGAEHIHTLYSRNNLANRYAAVGRHQDAVDLDELTLSQRRQHLGDTHADTLMSQNNLAVGYAGLGRHSEAFQLDRQTAIQSEQILGPNHPDTLASQHNLAIRHIRLGRIRDGLELARIVLNDRERELGFAHPDTLITRKLISLIETIEKDNLAVDGDAALERDLQGVNRRLESLGLEDL